MNIRINYDLIDYVKNVNEPYGPFKVVRNQRKKMVKTYMPALFLIDFALIRDFKYVATSVPVQTLSVVLGQTLAFASLKIDPFKDTSEFYLKKLVPKLQDININTDYDLLKKSQLEDKIYNVKLNEKKIPELIESKYILIPSYDYKGDIKDTQVLQEHKVLSNEYILSIGSKQKQKKLVFATNNA